MINMRLRDDTGREVFVRVKMSAPSMADLAQIMSDFGQADQPAPREGNSEPQP